MTQEEWNTCIRDSLSLKSSAMKSAIASGTDTGDYIVVMTDALYLTLDAMRGDSMHVNSKQWNTNCEDLSCLLRKLGNYAIARRGHNPIRINLTAEYAEIMDILEAGGIYR